MNLLPTTIEELSEIVRDANERNEPLVPWGVGTRQHIGRPAESAAQIVGVAGLNRLVAHVPADMTITVEAGMAIGDLQAHLRAYNQWLPWDLPAPQGATIGGLLATAASGPLRLGYGTPRDWVLGMRAVLGDGRIVKSGGNVVKNVAGYDLHKLHIGALGTLGIISEITFKVFPTPNVFGTVAVAAPTLATALAHAETFRAAPLVPVSLVVVGEKGVFCAFARYAGVVAAVRRQMTLAQERVAGSEAVETDDDIWVEHAQFAQPSHRDHAIMLRAGAAPARLGHVLTVLQQHAPDVPVVQGYAGVGVAYARWPASNDVPERLASVRAALQPHNAYAVVEYAPASFNSSLDLWGAPPQTMPLMRALKAKWDPNTILNRGRYLV